MPRESSSSIESWFYEPWSPIAESRWPDPGIRVCWSLVLLLFGVSSVQAQSFSGSEARALVDQYCVGCHNETQQTAGLLLDTMDLDDVGQAPETWEKVVLKLRTGMMPPADARRLASDVRGDLASWLEDQIDRRAAVDPNPGRPALHRMNRTEYGNAIRDLLDLEIDVESLLPGDASSYGFDNIAGTLVTSPVLLERYVATAGKISRLAVGDPTIPPSQETYVVTTRTTQTEHIEGLPFGTRGGMLVDHNFPVDGEYEIQIKLFSPGGGLYGSNNAANEQAEFSLNGERIELFEVGDYDPAAPYALRIPVLAGPQSLGVAFLKKNHAPLEDLLRPFEYSIVEPSIGNDPNWTFYPHLDSITITGPYGVTSRGSTPSREKIFICRPGNVEEEDACARQIISSLAERAYRRPSSAEDLEVLMDFYEEGRGKGSFDAGIEMALRRILASTEFIFRFERDPLNLAPGEGYALTDLELASRLSFFLWSSIPDPELLALAGEGRLREPAVLEAQVRRMLADPRSRALVENFAGQWFYLRNLENIDPDYGQFADFDANLKQALRRETELFFESIIREDRNVVDLLSANDTFLNERLATHYGIPGVYGSHFRRVVLGEEFDYRRGLLGQGSILMLTSYPNRTSPVQRGKWILERILGAPVPTPPPNVPELEETAVPGVELLSVRERMENHRRNPVCAACHKIMDPIGFSMENFDAVGKFRSRDEGSPIDASGELVDGTRMDGPSGLRTALLGYSHQFVQNMTERLLTYALGRGLEYYDMPVVRSIARDAAADDYRFSSLVLGVVQSVGFQMKTLEMTETIPEVADASR